MTMIHTSTPANQLITKEDLHEFKINLLSEIKQILGHSPETRKWLRSSEVRKLMNISAGTLHSLRVNGTLTYTKVGNILYYNTNEIQKLLSNSHSLDLEYRTVTSKQTGYELHQTPYKFFLQDRSRKLHYANTYKLIHCYFSMLERATI